MYDMRFTIYDLGMTNDNSTGVIVGSGDIVIQKSNIVNGLKLKTRNREQ